MGHQFPLRSARGLGLQVTFANRSRQAAVRFDLTFGAQLRINREQQLSIEDLVNSRLRAVATVMLVWAVIYLPALGSIAIKGEEGRRILPAVRMLETGNYIVPQVGSNPYYRKPPLVNWLVAASFKFFGVRNEWTARLPSAFSVLAVAIAFVTVARASLGARGSIIAAMIWLTNIGIIEKGRLIEIEGVVCLSLRSGDYFLAELLSSKEIAVAYLASGICFSRAWSAGKRPDAPVIFLRDCARRSGLLERLAASCSSCTFRRARRHDWDRGGMGDSVRPHARHRRWRSTSGRVSTPGG